MFVLECLADLWPAYKDECTQQGVLWWLQMSNVYLPWTDISQKWRCDQSNRTEWSDAKSYLFPSVTPVCCPRCFPLSKTWFCLSNRLYFWLEWSCNSADGADQCDAQDWHQKDLHVLWEQFLPQHGRESKQLLGTAWYEQVNKHECCTRSFKICKQKEVINRHHARMQTVTLAVNLIFKANLKQLNDFYFLPLLFLPVNKTDNLAVKHWSKKCVCCQSVSAKLLLQSVHLVMLYNLNAPAIKCFFKRRLRSVLSSTKRRRKQKRDSLPNVWMVSYMQRDREKKIVCGKNMTVLDT